MITIGLTGVYRPSQLLYSHDVASDFFAWYVMSFIGHPVCREPPLSNCPFQNNRPAFREKLALTGQPALDDRFWGYFTRYVHFVWHLPPSSAFELCCHTGMYQFSGLFNNSARDIANFILDDNFFAAYPNTYYEIVLCR